MNNPLEILLFQYYVICRFIGSSEKMLLILFLWALRKPKTSQEKKIIMHFKSNCNKDRVFSFLRIAVDESEGGDLYEHLFPFVLFFYQEVELKKQMKIFKSCEAMDKYVIGMEAIFYFLSQCESNVVETGSSAMTSVCPHGWKEPSAQGEF